MLNPRSRLPARRRFIVGVALLAVLPLASRSSATSALVTAPTPLAREAWQYVSPSPFSRMNPPAMTLAIRPGSRLDPAAVRAGSIRVTGSASGVHDGMLRLAPDERTLIFVPRVPFAPDERVLVNLDAGIRTAAGRELPRLDFEFEIGAAMNAERRRAALESVRESLTPADAGTSSEAAAKAGPALASLADSLPGDWFPVQLTVANDPDSGLVFLSPFGGNLNFSRGRLLMLDNRAMPIFYRSLPAFAFDFKRQPNGLLTYFTETDVYVALDSTYTPVDSFAMGNGYGTDEHELQLLPNGHALLMAYDPQFYPMDTVVAGGNPSATVIGLVIQELDEEKNVVFQWRSWDHFRVTDMIECSGVLTGTLLDYVHANALELDQDGNILLSSRHLSEITKIDRQTGDVIWRMGRNAKRNEFTFLDDPRGFSHQHDIRRLPNGHLTLFDNGNCLPGFVSRALEYEVDEPNHTARLVWEYRNSPDVFTPFMGSAQRLPGGGTMIGWGGTGSDPKLTEIHADGSKAFELGFASSTRWTYRAFRFPWTGTAFTTDSTDLDLGDVEVGQETSRPLWITNHLATPLTLNQFISTDSTYQVASSDPIKLAPGASDSISVRFLPQALGQRPADLYVRSVNDTSLIAQVVHLRGRGTGVALTIDDVAGPEGAPGEVTPFTFTLRLSPPAADTVTVVYATADSSALAGDDYVGVAGHLWIPPGDSVATIVVDVLGDAEPEQHDVFHLLLLSAKNAVIVRALARGTILHDEGQLAVEPREGAGFALHAVRPNPARESAEITFDLPRAASVSAEIFDVRGRRVAALVDGPRAAGRHAVTWRTRGRAAGVYFVRLRAGEFTATRKLVVTK